MDSSTAPHTMLADRTISQTSEKACITECEIVTWHVAVGDNVDEFDPICEVASDKATVEITARFAGTIVALCYAEGEIAKVGQPLVEMESEDETNTSADNNSSIQTASELEPAKVAVQGSATQITATDAEAHHPITTSPSSTTVKLNPIERAMFRSMTESRSVPQFYLTENVDITNLELARTKTKQQTTGASGKITALTILIKTLSEVLKLFPRLNASCQVDLSTGQPHIEEIHSHDIGVAVDTPQGLVVPVVRRVQDSDVAMIAEEIARLAHLARTNRLGPEHFRNPSISISNIGSIGGDSAMPIVVPPMVAIIAVGRIHSRAEVASQSDSGRAQYSVNMTWAADHRVVDGATVARAATKMKEFLHSFKL